MSEEKYENIKYSKGYVFTGEINEIRYGYQKVRMDCVKRYNNCQYLLAKLNKCADMFLMYLTEQMDPINTVHITKRVRQDFLKHMKKNCGVIYEDGTVKKALASLKNSGLILNYGPRIDYTINPFYFFKGPEKERKDLIKNLLHDCATNEYPNSNMNEALFKRCS